MPPDIPCVVRRLGTVAYEAAFERMRAFTVARHTETPDEIWLLEHPPVYTLGVRARNRLVQPANDIPLVFTDRGGDVTYHGPGQPVVYALLDLARRGLTVHALVRTLEQAVIDLLADFGVAAERRLGAPGVYAADRKIASLGLRVRGGRSYHGLAFNAHMDLTPFYAIEPCGYPGLRMTQLAEWRSDVDSAEAGERLLQQVQRRLEYTDPSTAATKLDDVAHYSDARR
jgi:lipoyl(octanoyl) transferase